MLKPIIGIVAVTLVSPALADEYWVQYDYSTHECSVVQSATHQTETRFPWSPPNDGRKPKGALNDGSNEGTAAANGGETGNSSDSTLRPEGTNEAGTPDASNSTADATSEANTVDNSNTSANAANEASPPNEPKSTSTAGSNTNNNFEKELEASWKRKAELAKENKIDVSKALVGTAMQTQEEAEEEMQIMRICGLKN